MSGVEDAAGGAAGAADEEVNLLEVYGNFVLNVKVLGSEAGVGVPTLPVRVPQILEYPAADGRRKSRGNKGSNSSSGAPKLSFDKLLEIVIMISSSSQHHSPTPESQNLRAQGKRRQHQVLLSFPNPQTKNAVMISSGEELLEVMKRHASQNQLTLVAKVQQEIVDIVDIVPELTEEGDEEEHEEEEVPELEQDMDSQEDRNANNQKQHPKTPTNTAKSFQSPDRPGTAKTAPVTPETPAGTPPPPPLKKVRLEFDPFVFTMDPTTNSRENDNDNNNNAATVAMKTLMEQLLQVQSNRMQQLAHHMQDQFHALLQQHIVTSEPQLKQCIKDTVQLVEQDDDDDDDNDRDCKDSISIDSDDDDDDMSSQQEPTKVSTAAANLEKIVKDQMVSMELRFAKLEEQHSKQTAVLSKLTPPSTPPPILRSTTVDTTTTSSSAADNNNNNNMNMNRNNMNVNNHESLLALHQRLDHMETRMDQRLEYMEQLMIMMRQDSEQTKHATLSALGASPGRRVVPRSSSGSSGSGNGNGNGNGNNTASKPPLPPHHRSTIGATTNASSSSSNNNSMEPFLLMPRLTPSPLRPISPSILSTPLPPSIPSSPQSASPPTIIQPQFTSNRELSASAISATASAPPPRPPSPVTVPSTTTSSGTASYDDNDDDDRPVSPPPTTRTSTSSTMYPPPLTPMSPPASVATDHSVYSAGTSSDYDPNNNNNNNSRSDLSDDDDLEDDNDDDKPILSPIVTRPSTRVSALSMPSMGDLSPTDSPKQMHKKMSVRELLHGYDEEEECSFATTTPSSLSLLPAVPMLDASSRTASTGGGALTPPPPVPTMSDNQAVTAMATPPPPAAKAAPSSSSAFVGAGSSERKMKQAIKEHMESMESRLSKLREINQRSSAITPLSPTAAAAGTASTVRNLFPASRDTTNNDITSAAAMAHELEQLLAQKLQESLIQSLQSTIRDTTRDSVDSKLADLETLLQKKLEQMQKAVAKSAALSGSVHGPPLSPKRRSSLPDLQMLEDLVVQRMDQLEKLVNSTATKLQSQEKQMDEKVVATLEQVLQGLSHHSSATDRAIGGGTTNRSTPSNEDDGSTYTAASSTVANHVIVTELKKLLDQRMDTMESLVQVTATELETRTKRVQQRLNHNLIDEILDLLEPLAPQLQQQQDHQYDYPDDGPSGDASVATSSYPTVYGEEGSVSSTDFLPVVGANSSHTGHSSGSSARSTDVISSRSIEADLIALDREASVRRIYGDTDIDDTAGETHSKRPETRPNLATVVGRGKSLRDLCEIDTIEEEDELDESTSRLTEKSDVSRKSNASTSSEISQRSASVRNIYGDVLDIEVPNKKSAGGDSGESSTAPAAIALRALSDHDDSVASKDTAEREEETIPEPPKVSPFKRRDTALPDFGRKKDVPPSPVDRALSTRTVGTGISKEIKAPPSPFDRSISSRDQPPSSVGRAVSTRAIYGEIEIDDADKKSDPSSSLEQEPASADIYTTLEIDMGEGSKSYQDLGDRISSKGLGDSISSRGLDDSISNKALEEIVSNKGMDDSVSNHESLVSVASIDESKPEYLNDASAASIDESKPDYMNDVSALSIDESKPDLNDASIASIDETKPEYLNDASVVSIDETKPEYLNDASVASIDETKPEYLNDASDDIYDNLSFDGVEESRAKAANVEASIGLVDDEDEDEEGSTISVSIDEEDNNSYSSDSSREDEEFFHDHARRHLTVLAKAMNKVRAASKATKKYTRFQEDIFTSQREGPLAVKIKSVSEYDATDRLETKMTMSDDSSSDESSSCESGKEGLEVSDSTLNTGGDGAGSSTGSEESERIFYHRARASAFIVAKAVSKRRATNRAARVYRRMLSQKFTPRRRGPLALVDQSEQIEQPAPMREHEHTNVAYESSASEVYLEDASESQEPMCGSQPSIDESGRELDSDSAVASESDLVTPLAGTSKTALSRLHVDDDVKRRLAASPAAAASPTPPATLSPPKKPLYAVFDSDGGSLTAEELEQRTAATILQDTQKEVATEQQADGFTPEQIWKDISEKSVNRARDESPNASRSSVHDPEFVDEQSAFQPGSTHSRPPQHGDAEDDNDRRNASGRPFDESDGNLYDAIAEVAAVVRPVAVGTQHLQQLPQERALSEAKMADPEDLEMQEWEAVAASATHGATVAARATSTASSRTVTNDTEDLGESKSNDDSQVQQSQEMISVVERVLMIDHIHDLKARIQRWEEIFLAANQTIQASNESLRASNESLQGSVFESIDDSHHFAAYLDRMLTERISQLEAAIRAQTELASQRLVVAVPPSFSSTTTTPPRGAQSAPTTPMNANWTNAPPRQPVSTNPFDFAIGEDVKEDDEIDNETEESKHRDLVHKMVVTVTEWKRLQDKLRGTEEVAEAYRKQVLQLRNVLEVKINEGNASQHQVELLQRKLQDAHDREIQAQKQLRPVTRRVEQVIQEMVELEERSANLQLENGRLREQLWLARREF